MTPLTKNISEAILSLNSNAVFSVTTNGKTGSDFDWEVEWYNDTTPISKENIKTEMDKE
jgi:hypothetical protein